MIPAEYAGRSYAEPNPGLRWARTVQDEGAVARIERGEELRFARGHLRMFLWHATHALRWTGVSLRARLGMGVFWTFLWIGWAASWVGLGPWLRRLARDWSRKRNLRILIF